MSDISEFIQDSDFDPKYWKPFEAGLTPEESKKAKETVHSFWKLDSGHPVTGFVPGAAAEAVYQKQAALARDEEDLLNFKGETYDGISNIISAKWRDSWPHWEAVKHFLFEDNSDESMLHPRKFWSDEEVDRVVNNVPQDMWDHFLSSYSSKDLERKFTALDKKQELDRLWSHYLQRPNDYGMLEGVNKFWMSVAAPFFDPVMVGTYMLGGMASMTATTGIATGAYTATRIASVGKVMKTVKKALIALPAMGVAATIDGTIGTMFGHLMQQDDPLFSDAEYLNYVVWTAGMGSIFGAWDGARAMSRVSKQLKIASKARFDHTGRIHDRYGGREKVSRMIMWFQGLRGGDRAKVLRAIEQRPLQTFVDEAEDALFGIDQMGPQRTTEQAGRAVLFPDDAGQQIRPGWHKAGPRVDEPRFGIDEFGNSVLIEGKVPAGTPLLRGGGPTNREQTVTRGAPDIVPFDPEFGHVIGGEEAAMRYTRNLDVLEHMYEQDRLITVQTELQVKEVIERNTKFDNIIKDDLEILRKHGITTLDDTIDALKRGEMGETTNAQAKILNDIFDGKSQSLTNEEILDLLKMPPERLAKMDLAQVLKEVHTNRAKVIERMKKRSAGIQKQIEAGLKDINAEGDIISTPEGPGLVVAVKEDGTLTVRPLKAEGLRYKLKYERDEYKIDKERLAKLRAPAKPKGKGRPGKPTEASLRQKWEDAGLVPFSKDAKGDWIQDGGKAKIVQGKELLTRAGKPYAKKQYLRELHVLDDSGKWKHVWTSKRNQAAPLEEGVRRADQWLKTGDVADVVQKITKVKELAEETGEAIKAEKSAEVQELEAALKERAKRIKEIAKEYAEAEKTGKDFSVDMATALKYDIEARYGPATEEYFFKIQAEPGTSATLFGWVYHRKVKLKGRYIGEAEADLPKITSRRYEGGPEERPRWEVSVDGKPHKIRVLSGPKRGKPLVLTTRKMRDEYLDELEELLLKGKEKISGVRGLYDWDVDVTGNDGIARRLGEGDDTFSLAGKTYEEAIKIVKKKVRQELLEDIENTVYHDSNVDNLDLFAADNAPRDWMDMLNREGIIPKEITDRFGDFSIERLTEIIENPKAPRSVRANALNDREGLLRDKDGTEYGGEGEQSGGNALNIKTWRPADRDSVPMYTKAQKVLSGFFGFRHRPLFQSGPNAVRQMAFDVLGGWQAPYDRWGNPAVAAGPADSVIHGGLINYRRWQTHELLYDAAVAWRDTQLSFHKTMRGNGHSKTEINDLFHKLHKLYVDTRATPGNMRWYSLDDQPLPKEAQDAIIEAAEATAAHYKNVRQWGIDHGVEELAAFPANPGYFPRMKDVIAMENVIANAVPKTLTDGTVMSGKDQLRELIRRGLAAGDPKLAKEHPEALDLLSKTFVDYYLDISSHRPILDSILGSKGQSIDDLLHSIDRRLRSSRSSEGTGGFDKKTMRDLKKMLKESLTPDEGTRHALYRIKLDQSASMKMEFKDGIREVTLSEMFLTDTMQAAGRYTMEIITQAQKKYLLKRYSTENFKPKSVEELFSYFKDQLEHIGYRGSEVDHDLGLLLKYVNNDPKFVRNNFNSIMATAMQGATFMKLPQFTRAGFPEWMMAKFSIGVVNILLDNIPLIGQYIRDMRGGRANKETVIEFLHHSVGGGKVEGIVSDQYGRWQLTHEGDPLVSGRIGGLHQRLTGATHKMSIFALYRSMNESADIAATRNFLDILVRAARGNQRFIRMLNDTRLAQLGWTRAEVDSILEELLKDGMVTRQKLGKVGSDYTINWDRMDPVVRARLKGGARQNLSQVVQRSSSADLPYTLITNGTASLLTQFRAFSISSQANHFARNLQVRDAQAFSQVMSMAMGGVMVHLLKSYTRYHDDPEELQKALSIERIAAGAMLYAGMMGIAPDIIDSMIYYGSGEEFPSIFSPGDAPLTLKIPVADVIAQEYYGATALFQSLFTGKMNKQQFSRIKNATPYANVIYIETLLDLFRGEFPKK